MIIDWTLFFRDFIDSVLYRFAIMKLPLRPGENVSVGEAHMSHCYESHFPCSLFLCANDIWGCSTRLFNRESWQCSVFKPAEKCNSYLRQRTLLCLRRPRWDGLWGRASVCLQRRPERSSGENELRRGMRKTMINPGERQRGVEVWTLTVYLQLASSFRDSSTSCRHDIGSS